MFTAALQPTLTIGTSAFLRPIHQGEVTQEYVDGLNDPKVHRFLVGPRKQRQTIETVRQFVQANWESPDSLLFGFFLHDKLCGTIRLHDIGKEDAYLGLALFDRSVWGQGWGGKMIRAVADYALTTIGVHCVRAGIEEENVASQRAFIKAGFLRQTDLYRGNYNAQIWILEKSDSCRHKEE